MVCLTDLRGTCAVIYFYSKDNPPGCTLEARSPAVARTS